LIVLLIVGVGAPLVVDDLAQDHRPLGFTGDREQGVRARGHCRSAELDVGAERDLGRGVGAGAPHDAVGHEPAEDLALAGARSRVLDRNAGHTDALLDGCEWARLRELDLLRLLGV